jgi:D-alanyl-lipoteichoic acid acyltransferase DltB (MBOAT superfamily)
MLFDSATYLLFLIAVTTMYWRLSWRGQNRLLLVASACFYAWFDWRFVILMMASITADYWLSLAISRATAVAPRRALLVIGLSLNVGVLGFFKYFNFFYASAVRLLDLAGLHHLPASLLVVLLPPAISFYTFQEMAYLIDVYHERVEPAASWLDYALFVCLFPHLIAGPIQRPAHLLRQVQQPRQWNAAHGLDGVLLILEGLFRKMVIADNCALLANAAYGGNLGAPSLAVVLLGTYAFAWQIYGDFSGYSSIARGSARLLGFDFMLNFRQPYLAESLSDFWHRWHISLSTWLRDYLYIPLGGNRGGSGSTTRNLLLTMLVGGLWHGANWTYVLWGGLHGLALAIERLLGPSRGTGQTRRWWRRILVFHVVCAGWILFRAPSLHDAWCQVVGLTVWQWQPVLLTATRFLALHAGLLLCLDVVLEQSGDESLFASSPPAARVLIGLTWAVLITLFGANQANAFLYFQF